MMGTVRCVVVMEHMSFATNMLATKQNFIDVYVVIASTCGRSSLSLFKRTADKRKEMANGQQGGI